MERFPLSPDEGRWIVRNAFALMETFPYAALYETRSRDDFGIYRLLFGLGSSWHPAPWEAQAPPAFWFGFLRYEAVQQWESLLAFRLPTLFHFPLSAFFRGDWVLLQRKDGNFLSSHPFSQWKTLIRNANSPSLSGTQSPMPLRATVSKAHYEAVVRRIKEEIAEGEYYELNLTVAFHGEGRINPYRVYSHLRKTAAMPFCFLLKWEGQYGIGASPERFLQKRGTHLCSQPIKGTIKTCPTLDRIQKAKLRSHPKFRAENVMIVDLVRNDLHRVCLPHRVWVSRMFEVQTFPYLHHLVSTIEGEVDERCSLTSVLQALFPPGSMTGAPKLAAIQAIERHEVFARELYSGIVGYVAPNGFADFCVVIRTLFYSERDLCYSYHAGGAITWDSDPEEEWSELWLKGEALRQVLN